MAFNAHTNSIRTCGFHPTVSGLVVSTAQDMTLRYFDAEQGREVSCMQVPLAVTINVSHNYDGSLIALAGKDRTVRIIDPRKGTVVASTTSDSALSSLPSGSRSSVALNSTSILGRNLRVVWCCTRTGGAYADPLITVSAGNSGLRQMHLWDPRALDRGPLITKSIDNASGQLFPLFDETMNTLFMVGKGDTIIRTYEMIFLEETTATMSTPSHTTAAATTATATSMEPVNPSLLEKSTDFQSSAEPTAGICMIPKRCCDVRNVEVARLLKLTSDALTPISFKVPRADHLKTFFHDDLFPAARAARSLATVPDWESAETDVSLFQPILESLQPVGMAAISTSAPEPTPSVVRSKVDSFKMELKKQEAESKLREDKFAKLQQLAVQNAHYNKNMSGGTNSHAAAMAASAPSNGGSSSKAGSSGASPVKPAVEEEVDSDDNWDDDN